MSRRNRSSGRWIGIATSVSDILLSASFCTAFGIDVVLFIIGRRGNLQIPRSAEALTEVTVNLSGHSSRQMAMGISSARNNDDC
jgi:hypothetical protein